MGCWVDTWAHSCKSLSGKSLELVEVEVPVMATTVMRWPFWVDVQKLARDVLCPSARVTDILYLDWVWCLRRCLSFHHCHTIEKMFLVLVQILSILPLLSEVLHLASMPSSPFLSLQHFVWRSFKMQWSFKNLHSHCSVDLKNADLLTFSEPKPLTQGLLCGWLGTHCQLMTPTEPHC